MNKQELKKYFLSLINNSIAGEAIEIFEPSLAHVLANSLATNVVSALTELSNKRERMIFDIAKYSDLENGFKLLLQAIDAARSETPEETWGNAFNAIRLSYTSVVSYDSEWMPYILPSGGLLIRNYHRVVSLDQPRLVLPVGSDRFMTIYKQLQAYNPRANRSALAVLIRHQEDGIYFGNNPGDSLSFSQHGQSFLQINQDIDLSKSELAEWSSEISEIISSSQTGIIFIRTFKNLSFVHTTSRDDVELNTVIETMGTKASPHDESQGVVDEGPIDASNSLKIYSRTTQHHAMAEAYLDAFSSLAFLSEDPTEGISPYIKAIAAKKFYEEVVISLIRRQLWQYSFFAPQMDNPTSYRGVSFGLNKSEKTEHGCIYWRVPCPDIETVADCTTEFLNKHFRQFARHAGSFIRDNVDTDRFSEFGIYAPPLKDGWGIRYCYERNEDHHEFDSADFETFLKKSATEFKSLVETMVEAGKEWDQSFEECRNEAWSQVEFYLRVNLDDFKTVAQVHHASISLSLSRMVNHSHLTVDYPMYGFTCNYSDGEPNSGNQHMLMTAQEEAGDGIK